MNICYSGGAQGADKFWGQLAEKLGHEVVHYSFDKHGCSVPKRLIKKLTQDELNEADPFLKEANKTLKRQFPTKSEYVNNLLRRNYWQIKDTDVVYAISEFDKDGNVYGGTAWAVQMAIDEGIPIYLYSQEKQCWFERKPDKKYIEIDITKAPDWIEGINTWHMLGIDPPKPKGKWTGIGTRSLTEDTKTVINNFLLEKC